MFDVFEIKSARPRWHGLDMELKRAIRRAHPSFHIVRPRPLGESNLYFTNLLLPNNSLEWLIAIFSSKSNPNYSVLSREEMGAIFTVFCGFRAWTQPGMEPTTYQCSGQTLYKTITYKYNSGTIKFNQGSVTCQIYLSILSNQKWVENVSVRQLWVNFSIN